jgi:hypothetical protein
VKKVADRIRELLPHFEGKQMALASHHDIRPADISMALNHPERKAAGKETVSEPAVDRMAEAFGVIFEEAAA